MDLLCATVAIWCWVATQPPARIHRFPLWTNLRCYTRFLPVFGRPSISEVVDFSGCGDETDAL
jgi:hypothetical protein